MNMKKSTPQNNTSLRPTYPQKLPGSFWGICTFFNPLGYKNKLKLYKIFLEKNKEQGLKLITVELAYSNKAFELSNSDADILIQIRGDESNIMWQKEAMINIAIKHLPTDCDKLAWLDADIIFKNDNWIEETSKKLEMYTIVQPFDTIAFLPKNKTSINSDKIKFGNKEKNKLHSRAYKLSKTKSKNSAGNLLKRGFMGCALAARRDVFDDIGLYDKNILGSNDGIIFGFLYGDKNILERINSTNKSRIDQDKYFEKIYPRAKGSISYTNGTIFHLWHGNIKNRYYIERDEIYKRNDFDPNTDIKLNKDGIYEWSSDKINLHKEVKKYFAVRKEEGFKILHCTYYFNSLNRIKDILKYKIYKYIGKVGLIIKKINPDIYKKMINNKPDFLK